MCKQLIYSETGANVTIILKTFSCLLLSKILIISPYSFSCASVDSIFNLARYTTQDQFLISLSLLNDLSADDTVAGIVSKILS